MVSQETFRTAVGVLGNIIALFLFLSPTPTFIRIWKKRSVEQYSPVPYLATLINCLVWVLYGLPMVHPNSFLVITINGAGIAIEVVYILIFLMYSDKKVRLRVVLVILGELVFFAALSFLVLRLAHTWEKRSTVVGIVCILFNIMMYASPLAVMKLVITTKSVEFMPFSLSMASFANGVAWSAYALIRFDKFIFIPNGLGAIFSLAQLALYATYYKNTKRMIAAREAKGELGVDEIVISSGDLKKTSAAQNGHV